MSADPTLKQLKQAERTAKSIADMAKKPGHDPAWRDQAQHKYQEAKIALMKAELEAAEASQTVTVAEPTVVPPPPAYTVDVPPANVSAPHVMTFNSKDQYEATLGNLIRVLTVQPIVRIAYDEFQACIVTAPLGTEQWELLTDAYMVDLRHKIEVLQGFAPIGRELMRDALLLIANRNKFDSAAMWLDGLVWDGVPRIERFMHTYCGAVDDEYTRACGMYMWTGLAGRVLEPGSQLDMVIAMQSPQGRKKSTGFRLLAPTPEWFIDNLSLQHDDDNFKRLLRGKVIIEISEMAGLSKADVNQVKGVITRRTEEWIEKYQTVRTRFDRRCMLFASTNNEKFLPADETGHRRWLPIQIVDLDRERIAADREQLWAEGAVYWRAAGILYADAERLATGRHKQYEQDDVWETKIADWLVSPRKMGDKTGPPPGEKPFTVADVLQGAIGMTTERMDARAEKRAGSVLRLLGYEKRNVRIDGRVTHRWMPAAVPPPPVE